MAAAAALVWFLNQSALHRVTAERDRLQQQIVAGIRGNGSGSIPMFAARGDVSEQTLAQLRKLNNQSAIMGEANRDAVQLLRPKGTLVGSLRPLLVWKLTKPIPGATHYEITIVNAQTPNASNPEEHTLTLDLRGDENGSRRLSQPGATPPEACLQVPDGLLKPDTIYSWSVEVKGENKEASFGGSSPDAQSFFGTLTTAQMGQLGQVAAPMGVLDDAEPALAADARSAESRRLLDALRKLRADFK